MKKRRIGILGLNAALLVGVACGAKPPAPTPAAAAPASSKPSGVVTLPADSPKLRELRVEAVRRESVAEDVVVSPGKVEMNPNRVSKVLLPVPGRISTVQARVGDSVRAGQVLVTVESNEASDAVGGLRQAETGILQAETGLTLAKAAQAKAQSDYDRTRDLFEHRAVAQKEVLNAENILTQAKAGVEQAQAAVKQAKTVREQAERRLGLLGITKNEYGQKIAVRAPLNGKIMDLSVVAGEYRTDTGTALMTVADLSSVVIAANVPETGIRFISLGEPVEITLTAFPGATFSGRVARIADGVDPQTRTIRVLAEVANPGFRIRPEMFGQVRHAHGAALQPVVPVAALIESEGGTSVFVERRPGEFELRKVTVGTRSGDRVAVTSGLAEGDRVVVSGTFLLLKDQETRTP